MSLLLDDDQREFAAAARAVFDRTADSRRVRAVHDAGTGFDGDCWQALVELGAPAVLIPEEYDGLGRGLTEAALLMESCGRMIAPVPLYTALLGAAAVLASEDPELQRELLPAVASGELLVAPAFTEAAASWIPESPQTRFSDGAVTGVKTFVRDGQFADRLLVLAHRDGERVIVVVDAADAGLLREPLGVLDRSVWAARVTAQDVPARAVAIGDVDAYLDRVDSVASVLLAAAQYGAFQRALEITTQYAKDRFQFGRSIGSFQGVKHPLAEWATESELALSLLRSATSAGDGGAPDFRAQALAVQVKMQSKAFWAASWMARIHGGIGFTWEHDSHLFVKQAKTSQVLLGTPGVRLERLAQALGV
jgi:alkylation response protein AidB-like acyl-CoA dehydrogenase